MEQCTTCEQFKFDFFGFKMESVNPGAKSIIMLLLLLGFIIGAFLLCKPYLLPAVAIGGGKGMVGLISKIPFLKKNSSHSP
jgi:hypothetical protein